MEQFPANSHASKADEPRKKKDIAAVTKGEVAVRKKPLGRRVSETFVGGDAKSTVNYVLFEVLIPAAKDMIAESFTSGVERMLFGDRARPRSGGGYRGPGSPTTITNYRGISQSQSSVRADPRQQMTRRGRATHDFGELVLATRAEADEVLQGLFEILENYPEVTVADLYSLAALDSDYTDNKWGWTDLRDARVGRVRGGGFTIELPKPVELE